MNSKTLTFLSLAAKAGAVTSGDTSAEQAIKAGRGHLVIVADDASEPTKKKYRSLCENCEVPVFFISDREELGHYIGKEYRAILVLTDKGFARALIKKLEQDDTGTALEEQR